MATLHVGMIGLGAMGFPMARNLLAAGFSVTVLPHRNLEKPAMLAALGAKVVDSFADLAHETDVIIMMLPSSHEVETVLTSTGGLGDALHGGHIVIDMGTSDPTSTRRIAQALAARGVDHIDAPVTGGTKGAEEGSLTILVGGPQGVLDRVRPILLAMGTTILHVGECGAGHTTKIINNLVALCTAAVIAEGLALAGRTGIEGDTTLGVLEQGSANSAVLRDMAMRLRQRDLSPGFRLALAHKDLALATTLASAVGLSLPITSTARQVFTWAMEAGLGGLDVSAIVPNASAWPGKSF